MQISGCGVSLSVGASLKVARAEAACSGVDKQIAIKWAQLSLCATSTLSVSPCHNPSQL